MQLKNVFTFASIFFVLSCAQRNPEPQTTITRWQDDKTAAVSITFDDGTRNQFSIALPMLNKLKMPATFYIITGEVEGSQYEGKFIGRPIADIIAGTADTLTNKENFFERASAIGFSGYKGALAFHTDAGTLFEAGKVEEAYRLIDSGYRQIRNGKFSRVTNPGKTNKHLTWAAVREYAAQGHEFGSHTVTHPRLAVLTEPNMMYELEKSREDILKQMGERYTFSAECPYGTEDERVMSYAHKVYPALRNRMPEKFMEELNRSSKVQPGTIDKEYVQWQRGATTKTPMPMMKSWVDTVLANDNNWLVLVFHGVEGVGWEALSKEMLQEYFDYMSQREDKLWVATFADVTKYIRERMNADVKEKREGDKITIEVTHQLDTSTYNVPLTLKTAVPREWGQVQIKQGNQSQTVSTVSNDQGTFIVYRLQPNKGVAELSSSAK